jgi:ribose transport system substrate-binding protein
MPRARAGLIGRVVLGWIAAAVIAGCGGAGTESRAPGPSADGPPRFLFISNTTADWWLAAEKGVLDGAKDFGCEAELRQNDGTVQGQINKLREALSLPGIKGVAVSALEANAPGIVDAMQALQKAGIVVITIDADVAPEYAIARRGYIGTNNVKAGETLGKAAALLRPEGGNVATFVGTSGSANAVARAEGFFQGAGAAFKKLQTYEDFNDFAKNQQNVQTALTKEPRPDILLGLWAYNAPILAEEAAKSSRKDALSVVTFDLAEAAIPHLESGRIAVSVVQNPYEMGYQGVRLLKAFVENDDKTVAEVLADGQMRDTGVRVVVPNGSAASAITSEALGGVTVETIDELKSWLQSKGLKSS